MIKNLFISFIAIIIFILLSQTKVQAHIMEISNDIGAVMHISPEDDPIIGEPASFFFQFKDKTNRFSPQKCTCTVSLLQDNKIIYTAPLFQENNEPNLTNASFTYTFTEKDIYKITITGKPQKIGDFSPFTLSYDIRVSREPSTNTTNKSTVSTTIFHSVHYFIFGIGFIIIIYLIVKENRKNKKQ